MDLAGFVHVIQFIAKTSPHGDQDRGIVQQDDGLQVRVHERCNVQDVGHSPAAIDHPAKFALGTGKRDCTLSLAVIHDTTSRTETSPYGEVSVTN